MEKFTLSQDRLKVERGHFFEALANWWVLDINRCLEMWYSVGLDWSEISEIVVEHGRDCWWIELLDIVSVIYQHLLEEALASVEAVSGVDLNMYWLNIYCNSLETSAYIVDDNNWNELQGCLRSLSDDIIDDMANDAYVAWMFRELGLSFYK